jgi:DNA-directed DNA polymerase III PolC
MSSNFDLARARGRASYAPLRVHGHHSLLTATDSPRALLRRAAELGLGSLALTDIDTGAGLVEFVRAAREEGVRPILGAEFSDPQGRPGRVVALVEDEHGYANLCRLLSIRALGGDPGRLGARLAGPQAANLAHAAAEHARGLVFLADHPRTLLELHGRVDARNLYAAISSASLAVKETRQGATARNVGSASGRTRREHAPDEWERPRDADELLDLPKPPAPERPVAARELVEAARALGVATLAVPDVHCARPTGLAGLRLRAAAKHAALLEDLPESFFAPTPCHMPSAAELEAACAALPECAGPHQPRELGAMRRTLEVAERCGWTPPLDRVLLPTIELPAGETAYSRLVAMAFAGASRRYRPLKPEVVRRLDHELSTIDRLGYAPYFLLVDAIAAFARGRGIPCVGRGSAADSLVAYCLGMTDADPLRYELVFERFLNPCRRDRPDIDLDFCWRRRDEVLEHVYSLFGPERTAMIATVATCGPRAAFREAALAEGVPPPLVARWSRRLPWRLAGGGDAPSAHDGSAGDPSNEIDNAAEALESGGSIAEALRGAAGGAGIPFDEPRLARALAAADGLLGAPRFFGLHPGGTVVAPGPTSSFAPCARARKGHLVVQYDKDSVEAIGLVKMDLLGNRALTVLDDCVEALRARGVVVDLASLPEDDPATARALAEGRTLGCFQVESPGMRHLLQQMDARTMDHVIQAVALIRPGPAGSGMKDAYIRRARGVEEPRPPHPRLAHPLRLTHGVLLYQEDVMVAASLLAGMDLGEADLLRRALQKRRMDELPALRERFVAGCAREGVEADAALAAWELVANFASFGFCKAHAVTYGRIAYRAAWLKTRHPAEYLAAFLASDTGYYDQRVYVEEARRLGVAILPPCVNRSGRDHAVERTRGGAAGLRVPLSRVKGLSERALSGLLRARAEGGAYTSLPDLAERAPLDRGELEALVKCGACACFDRTIPELLWRAKLLKAAPTGKPPADLDREALAACRAAREGRAGRDATPGARTEASPEEALDSARRAAAGWRGAGIGLGRATLEPGQDLVLFPEPQPGRLALPRLPELGPLERGRLEHELLGLTVEAHPTELFPCAAELRAARAGRTLRAPTPCVELRRMAGARIALRGWLAASRRVHAADGRPMRFLTLEDPSGIAEVVVFPDVHERDAEHLAEGGVLRVVGVVEERFGSFTLHAERVE